METEGTEQRTEQQAAMESGAEAASDVVEAGAVASDPALAREQSETVESTTYDADFTGESTAADEPQDSIDNHMDSSVHFPEPTAADTPTLGNSGVLPDAATVSSSRNGSLVAASQGIRAPSLTASYASTAKSYLNAHQRSGRKQTKQLGSDSPTKPTSGSPSIALSISVRSVKEADLRPIYNTLANEEGLLPFDKLMPLLMQMGITFSEKDLQVLISSLSPDIQALTFEETMVVCGLLQGPAAAQQQRFSKFLSQRRSYMLSGVITVDEAVMGYMRKLEDHRKKCESSGRYPEARAAMRRLSELKSAQAVKIKQDLLSKQQQELEDVHGAFELALTGFCDSWDQRVMEYESAVTKQVEELQNIHQGQMMSFIAEMESRKPVKPKFSRDYLNQRKIEEHLAKQGEYVRAQQVKQSADGMYTSELDNTIATWESEVRMKQARLAAKQQQELEVVLKRGARGRDELDSKRTEEMERKQLRYKATVAELQNLHKLELVNFENFLEGQAIAGKFERLKDSSFRRKRELLIVQF